MIRGLFGLLLFYGLSGIYVWKGLRPDLAGVSKAGDIDHRKVERQLYLLSPLVIIGFVVCNTEDGEGFFISARLPAIRERGYVPESAVDKFAVTVTCDNHEHFKRAEAILREAGAEQTRELAEEG